MYCLEQISVHVHSHAADKLCSYIAYSYHIREHMNPSPTNGGIQVQVKLLRPRSSSHMAFASHGIPALPVQSSVLWSKTGQWLGCMAINPGYQEEDRAYVCMYIDLSPS